MKSLAAEPPLKDFFLVGGTSLALQIGHRKSVDLDLFSHQAFDSVALLAFLRDRYEVQPLTVTNTIFISVINGIKVDCVHFKYPFAFPILETEQIRLADIRDIAPMKLDAVTKRGSKKDFYDMYYLFQQFTPDEILQWYSQMFQHSTSFHVIRSLTYFDDAEETEQPFLFDEKITWSTVKQRMVDIIQANF